MLGTFLGHVLGGLLGRLALLGALHLSLLEGLLGGDTLGSSLLGLLLHHLVLLLLGLLGSSLVSAQGGVGLLVGEDWGLPGWDSRGLGGGKAALDDEFTAGGLHRGGLLDDGLDLHLLLDRDGLGDWHHVKLLDRLLHDLAHGLVGHFGLILHVSLSVVGGGVGGDGRVLRQLHLWHHKVLIGLLGV